MTPEQTIVILGHDQMGWAHLLVAYAFSFLVGIYFGWIFFAKPANNDIRGQQPCPDLQPILQRIENKLSAIEGEVQHLSTEVTNMTDTNKSLDQAVGDLDTAITNKLAEDATLTTDAKAGLNESANVAKVEALVDKLNTETAAEKAVTDPAPVDVTVTGATAGGASVPEAPVDTSAAAPETQAVDPNTPNPIAS